MDIPKQPKLKNQNGLTEFSSSIVPEKPSVSEGGSLRLRLVLASSDPEREDTLGSCRVTWGQQRRQLVLRTDSGTPAQDPRVQYDPQGGWCGVRIDEVLYGDRGSLVLEATAKGTGIVYRGESVVNVWGECC